MDCERDSATDRQRFVKELPKVELHAHLTGSISRAALYDIWLRKSTAGLLGCDCDSLNPRTTIPPAAKGVDIRTFFPIFDKVIYSLITTQDDVISTTEAVLESFADDGVAYLELRTTPRASAGLTREVYITTVLNVIARHNASQARIRTRLILTIDRRMELADAEAVVDLAIKYKHRGVVGVDIAGNPLRGDVTTFTEPVRRAKESGLGITVHFGETASSGRDEELAALLAMQPDRLGHVIHLSEQIKQRVRQGKLGLELCLSCNVLAEMTLGGFVGHHFGEWRGSGCPVALSTDDVGIFESELSHEYEMAMEHFSISEDEAIALSRQAASIIFGSESDREYIYNRIETFKDRQGRT